MSDEVESPVETETEAPASKKNGKKEKAPKAAKKAPAPKAEKAPKPEKAPKVSQNGDLAEDMLPEDQIHAAVRCFGMLKDRTRIQILVLVNGERAVGDLCGAIGQSQPATSHHLALLKHSGLIVPVRTGKNNFYKLTKAGEIAVQAVRSFLEM